MNEPVAQLDERFSDPDAQPTPWGRVKTALEAAQLSWITTVRTDGRPHVTPLVAVWVDETLHFCTGPEEQKARNLASNPAVVVTTVATSGTTDSTSSSRAKRNESPTGQRSNGSPPRGPPDGTADGSTG